MTTNGYGQESELAKLRAAQSQAQGGTGTSRAVVPSVSKPVPSQRLDTSATGMEPSAAELGLATRQAGAPETQAGEPNLGGFLRSLLPGNEGGVPLYAAGSLLWLYKKLNEEWVQPAAEFVSNYYDFETRQLRTQPQVMRQDIKRNIDDAFQKEGFLGGLNALREGLGENRRLRQLGAPGSAPEQFPLEFFATEMAFDPLTYFPGWGLGGKLPGAAGRIGGTVEREYANFANGIMDLGVGLLKKLPPSREAARLAAVRSIEDSFRTSLGGIYIDNLPGQGADAINAVMNKAMEMNTGKLAFTPADARVLGIIRASADANPDSFWRFADRILEKRPQELVRDFANTYVDRLALKAKAVRLAERKAGDAWTGHLLYALETSMDKASATGAGVALSRVGKAFQVANRLNARWVLMFPLYAPGNVEENFIRMGIDGISPGMMNQNDYVALLSRYSGIPNDTFTTNYGYGEAAMAGIIKERGSAPPAFWQRQLDKIGAPLGTWGENLRRGVDVIIGRGQIRASNVLETASKREMITQAAEQELVKALRAEMPKEPLVASLFLDRIADVPAEVSPEIRDGLVRRMLFAAPQGEEAIRQVGTLMSADQINRMEARRLLTEVHANLDPVSNGILSEAVAQDSPAGVRLAVEKAKRRYVENVSAQLPHLLNLGKQMMDMVDVEIGRLEMAAVMRPRGGKVPSNLITGLRRELQLVEAEIYDMPRRLVDANVAKAKAIRSPAERTAQYLKNDEEEATILQFATESRKRLEETLGKLDDYVTREDKALMRAHREWTTGSMDNLVAHMNEDRALINRLNAERSTLDDETYFLLRDDGRSAIWAEHSLRQTEITRKLFGAVEPTASHASVTSAARAAVGGGDTSAGLAELDNLAAKLEGTISRKDTAYTDALQKYTESVLYGYNAMVPATQEWLKSTAQQAVDRAMVRFGRTFTNYDAQNVLDAAARNFDPFWIYKTRLLGYMARAGLTHPGLGYAFTPNDGKWWRSYPDGKIHIAPGVAINPLAGTGFNRTRWLWNDFYPPREQGAQGLLEFAERGFGVLPFQPVSFGFTPGPLLHTGAAVLDRLFGRDSALSDVVPTNINIFLTAAGAASADVSRVLQKALGGDFFNWRVRLELLEQFGKTPETAKPEEMNAALVTANQKMLLSDLLPGLRYVPEYRNQMRQAADATAEEMAGLPAGTFAKIRAEGKNPFDVVPLPATFTDSMRERFKGYDAMLALGGALARSDTQKANAKIQEFHDAVDTERQALYEEQLADDTQYQSGKIAFEQWAANKKQRDEKLADAIQALQENSIVPISDEMANNLTAEEKAKLLSGKSGFFVHVPLSPDERKLYSTLRGREVPALHPLTEAVDAWYGIKPEQFKQADGETDWDAFAEARNRFLDILPEKVTLPSVELPDIGVTGKPVDFPLKKEFLAYLSRRETPLEQQMRQGSLTYMRSWRALDGDVADFLRTMNQKPQFIGQFLSTDEEVSNLLIRRDAAERGGDFRAAAAAQFQADSLKRNHDQIVQGYRWWLRSNMRPEQLNKVKEWLRLFNPRQFLAYFPGGR